MMQVKRRQRSWSNVPTVTEVIRGNRNRQVSVVWDRGSPMLLMRGVWWNRDRPWMQWIKKRIRDKRTEMTTCCAVFFIFFKLL